YVHPEKRAAFWSEITRVLKPNGKIVIAEFKPRGIKINGTTLQHTAPLDYNLKVAKIRNFQTNISHAMGSIKTGNYTIVEFNYL
ncbi:MAG: hypothetical protein M3P33_04230, partial [bacterium]|nr:hypothetical protein [bacterium]